MSSFTTHSGDPSLQPFGSYSQDTGGDLFLVFAQLAHRQSLLTKPELCEQQAALLGPQGLFLKFARQVARQGRQAPLLADVQALEIDHDIARAEDAVDFVLGQYRRRDVSGNPYLPLSREHLCCIVFGDKPLFTVAERFVAADALRQQDSQYFTKLIATTRHSVERRFVFQGLLEHFDALLPIEQSIYPMNYRRAQHLHLEREQTLYGTLELDTSVRTLLEERSAEWLLENLGIIRGPLN